VNSRFGRSTIPLSDATELPTTLRADARVCIGAIASSLNDAQNFR
jgi:hypothetical protein